MKIRTKLTESILIILFLMLIVGLSGIYTSINIKSNLEHSLIRTVKPAAILNDITRHILYIQSNSFLHMIVLSVEDMKQYEEEIAYRMEKVEADLNTLENMFNDKIALDKLTDFHTAWNTYKRIQNEQVLPLSLANRDIEVSVLVKKSGVAGAAAYTVMDQLDKLHHTISDTAEENLKLSEQFSTRNLYIFLSIIFIAIVLGIFVGLKQSSLIAKSVNTVSKAAKLVAAGNFDQKVEVKTGDELEAMADSLNIMIVNMKTMVTKLQNEIEMRIEAEKKAVLAYSESNQIFNTSGGGMRLVDKNFNIIRINKSFSTISGLGEDETVGRKCYEILPGSRCHTTDCPLSRILSGEEYIENEVEKERNDGIKINCISIATPFRGAASEPIGIVEDLNDITELKRVQEQLIRMSEKKHRLFFENAPVGIIHYNEKGTITDVNNAIVAIYGSSRDSLIGLDLEDNPDKEFSKEIYKTLKGENGHFEGLYRSFTSNKKAHIKADWIPIIDDERFIGGVGIIEDMSERKLMESQFRQAQKMEAIGQLTGGIAHDFNNLLNVIQGYIELIMIDTDKADPLYKNLTKIRSSAVRAANLIRQLLIFSRKQTTINFTVLNLNNIIENFLKMIHRLIGEDITIKTWLEPNLWRISGDEGNIEQLIINLAINSRDAMPAGGILTIKTENTNLDEEYTRLTPYSRPGKYVCFSVEDTGSGMTPEILDHIFEPFFTTKEAEDGTGLGMSVAYGIVKDHGGWINTYSDMGSGTTFRIYFPVSSGTVKDKVEENFLLEDLQGKNGRILIIEDEDKVRDIASAILGDNGYVIYRAHNAKMAKDIFEEENGRFHLIFCDVVLPDENGIQLTNQLLSQNPELKILLASGYIGNKAQRNIINEKKIPFLQKPYSLPDLLMAVKDVLK